MKFVTLRNALAPIPCAFYREGQAASRLGMQWNGAAYVSTGAAFESESGTRECNALVRMARRGDVQPYDRETAEACGVQYIDLDWSGPEIGWVPKESK
jgi:hypothetical protein